MAIGWDYRFIIIFKNPSSRQREEFLVFIDIITDLFTNIFYLLAPQSHRTLQALMSGNSNQKLVSYLWPPPSSQFSTSHPSLCPGVSTFSASPESLTSSASPSSLLLSGPSLLLGWISASSSLCDTLWYCSREDRSNAREQRWGGRSLSAQKARMLFQEQNGTEVHFPEDHACMLGIWTSPGEVIHY